MVNTAHTHLSQNTLPRRSNIPNVQQPRDGVWQDNPAPPRERAASPQPVTVENDARTRHMSTKTPRPQNRYSSKRKTVPLMSWVKPVVKTELQRIAEQEKLSVSATGAAFLEKAIQQDIH